MDIKKLRQGFEKLPDIKGILYGSDFGFNESLNEYYHPDHTNHRLSYAFIMGAWMAWKTKAQVPEGFVLVPIKPTEKTLQAIFDNKNSTANAYKAIIKAQEQSHEK